MNDKINESFVACYDERGGAWIVDVPGNVEYISEQIHRYSTIAEDVFSASRDFIRPLEIEYSVLKYSQDAPIHAIHPMHETDDVDRVSVERYTIVDNNGVSSEDIPFDSYDDPADGVCYIGDIESIREQSYFTLRDYEGWVDRSDTQHVKLARYSETFEKQAPFDPIGITIVPWPILADSSPHSFTFSIHIDTTTDIWFEETAIGQSNRERLESFFERLFDRVDVLDTKVTSTGRNEEFRSIFPS